MEEGLIPCNEDQAERGNGSPAKVLRLVLVGKTGVGKSATGNSILGTKAFLSRASVNTTTTECKKASVDRPERRITVVDTPRFLDMAVSAEDTLKKAQTCIEMSSPGPHAIIVVIQAGRFTKEEAEAVERIQALFGKEANKYTVILFTRKEDLGDQTIREFVMEAEERLKCLIKACGGRYCAFNNKATGEEQEQQVSELLGIIDRMVRENGGTHYDKSVRVTSAGSGFNVSDILIAIAIGLVLGATIGACAGIAVGRDRMGLAAVVGAFVGVAIGGIGGIIIEMCKSG